jgi:hypothetical protein
MLTHRPPAKTLGRDERGVGPQRLLTENHS